MTFAATLDGVLRRYLRADPGLAIAALLRRADATLDDAGRAAVKAALDDTDTSRRLLLDVSILGAPVAKGRPRVEGGHTRTPTKTRKWEASASKIMRLHRRGATARGPVRVEITIVKPRPKHMHRRVDPEGLILAPVRPDIDNCCKAALDALQTAGVFRDDGHVVELAASKYYAEKTGSPRLVVKVYALKGT